MKALEPLRHRSFRLVWSGSLVSNIGTWMQAAALGYYTAHLTQSAGWSAIVAAGEFAPTALLGPIGGAIADRYPRRVVFLTATLVQGALAAGLTTAMALGRPGAPLLAVFALANGCVFALGFPSYGAIIPRLVPKDVLPGAIGLGSASWNLGRVVGPLIGTLLYQATSIAWVLAVNALSFLATAVALATVRVSEDDRNPAPLLSAIAAGFRFVRGDPGLRLNAGAICLNALCVAPFIGLIPVMVEKEFGGGKTAVGWLIAGQGIGAVATGAVFGMVTNRFGVRRVLVWAMTLNPLALILYALAPNAVVALPPIVACGSLYFFVLSATNTIANLRAPANLLGRVLSLNQVMLGGVYAFSLNLEGQLGDRLGLREVSVGGALVSLVVLAALRLLKPGVSAEI